MLVRNFKKQRGFTLIEAIVATFIFAIVVTSVIGVYVETLKANRRTDAIRSATETVRYISEFLSKEIRNGTIAYSGSALYACSLTYNTPGNSLEIINVDGDTECFYLGDGAGTASSSGPYLWIRKQPAGSALLPAQQLDLNYSQVSNLTFYVTPATLGSPPVSTVQPRVTITGTVVTNKDPQNIVNLPFETTISIPEYDVTGN